MMNSTLTNLTIFEFSNSFSVLITSILAIHFLLGFSLNCYIIFLFFSKVGKVDTSVFFALNNAAAEIVFSISALLYALFAENFILINYFTITLLTFLFPTTLSARLLFQCCVCLERYLAVVHPVTFLRFKPLRHRVVCAILGWICALGLGISACTSPLSAFKLLSVVSIIILAVQFFCCVSILKQLRHPGPRDMEREQAEMSAVKKKAFQIVFINLMTCLTQNFPTVVSYILEDVLSINDFSIAELISTTINIFAGFVQPVFILLKAGKLAFIKCS